MLMKVILNSHKLKNITAPILILVGSLQTYDDFIHFSEKTFHTNFLSRK